MSRKTKLHRKLNSEPAITFFGDPLDRLLSGGFTDELRKQLPKMDESVKKEALPKLIPQENPLRVVFYHNRCQCGRQEKVFGYFCRKVTETKKLGQVTSYKIVEPNGPPQELFYQSQLVPYCSFCIPCGIVLVKE